MSHMHSFVPIVARIKRTRQLPESESPPQADIAATFYDALASDYDLMTDFQKRFVAERPFFRLIVERYRIKRALDAGCGTGFHSLLLAQLGVEVTGFDVSQEMVKTAAEHARSYRLEATFLQAGFDGIARKIRPQFDAVFSLGNTLAHCTTPRELSGALSASHALLRPGGILFIQDVNYDRILAERQQIQSVKENGGTIFVRYYEYQAELVRFNILRLFRQEGVMRHHLESILLRPYRRDELVHALRAAGFPEVLVYGGITLQPFEALQSRDLVLLAHRD